MHIHCTRIVTIETFLDAKMRGNNVDVFHFKSKFNFHNTHMLFACADLLSDQLVGQITDVVLACVAPPFLTTSRHKVYHFFHLLIHRILTDAYMISASQFVPANGKSNLFLTNHLK